MAPPFSSAVVTGASGGIGLAITDELRARNIHVHGLALADDRFAELAAREGVTAHGIDVRDSAAVRATVTSVAPDVLVNNAGTIGALAALQSTEPDTLDALLDINLKASVHATRAALPAMIERGRGHIFFTGSIAATRPTANTAVYSATKAAIHAFADGLRLDLHGTGVRVTILAPGRVMTALYNEALGSSQAAHEQLYAGIDSLLPADIGALVGVALDMPQHVDVTRLEVVPTAQVYGGAQIIRS